MHRIAFPILLVACAAAAAAQESPPGGGIEPFVASVLSSHPELAFYEAEIEAARAEGRAARAWADPEVSASLGRKTSRGGESGLSHEGRAWSVSLAQTFEWPGRVALRKAVANRDLALAELALEGFRAELGGRVRSLAFRWLAADARAEAVEEVAARFRELREAFLAREPGGLTPQLEIRVIEAQELVLDRRATEARLDADTARIALNVLRGARPDEPLEFAAGPRQLARTPEAEAILALAIERNVGFRTRVVEVERQGLRVELARHERWPAVTVAPFVEEEKAGERERTVGLGLSVPLPVGGRTGAAIDAAGARRAQAEAGLRAARLDLERDVVAAVHAHRMHQATLERWPRATIDAFREAAAAADRHYRFGAVPVGTYLELQSAYLDAVENLLEAEQAALEAGLAIESLTSGAWRAMEVTP